MHFIEDTTATKLEEKKEVSVVEEKVSRTSHQETVCSAAFEVSELGLLDIENNEMSKLERKSAIRISSTSDNARSNDCVSPVLITVEPPSVDDKHMDSPNAAKKPIRIASGRKESRTKQYEQLLSNYDIIDRTEAKNIQPIPEPFSFVRIFNKLRRTLAIPLQEDAVDGDSENHPFVQSTGIVNVSFQETQEGEQMQVCSFSFIKILM